MRSPSTSQMTLRRSSGDGSLGNRSNVNRSRRATEILGALKTGVRRNDAKVRAYNLGIASATSSITLIETLSLESQTKRVDSSSSSVSKIGNHVRRRRRLSASDTRKNSTRVGHDIPSKGVHVQGAVIPQIAKRRNLNGRAITDNGSRSTKRNRNGSSFLRPRERRGE